MISIVGARVLPDRAPNSLTCLRPWVYTHHYIVSSTHTVKVALYGLVLLDIVGVGDGCGSVVDVVFTSTCIHTNTIKKAPIRRPYDLRKNSQMSV